MNVVLRISKTVDIRDIITKSNTRFTIINGLFTGVETKIENREKDIDIFELFASNV